MPRLSHLIPRKLLRLALLLCAAGSFSTMAQPKDDGGPPGGGGAPAEAIAACTTLTAGQACSFSGRRGSETGTCWAPADKPLACKPANAPQPGGISK
jgi:hypothetical protein